MLSFDRLDAYYRQCTNIEYGHQLGIAYTHGIESELDTTNFASFA